MAFDGLVLAALARELRATLIGARIDRVQQPTPEDLVLTLRAERQNVRLLLSANKTYPRAHLTTLFFAPGPPTAPMFCMLMRKHLEGGRISDIRQHGRERILFIDVETRNELGDRVTRRLVAEFMGKHSNLTLLSGPDGIILDAIFRITRAVNRHREILPGCSYVYPPEQAKMDPLLETRQGYLDKRQADPDSIFERHLVDAYWGVSPFFAREAAFRMADAKPPSPSIAEAEREWLYFADVLSQAEAAEQPTLIRDHKGGLRGFYVFPPRHMAGEAVHFASVSACLDEFYTERAVTDILRAKTSSYLRLMRNHRDRARQKIEKFSALQDAAAAAENWRVAGELLTAYLNEIPRSARAVELPNFYDGDQLQRIELDLAKTPLENANAYFKRYQKYKKGIDVTREQLEQARMELAYAESVLHELETCRLSALPAIEAELREAGFVKTPEKSGKKGKPSKTGNPGGPRQTGKSQSGSGRAARQGDKTPHATYRATDGTAIFVGRNNRENDALANKLAKKTDIWLHVKDAPGSHVVIAHPQPSDQTVLEAALLAAHFSSLRESAKAPVDVVPVKNLRKPPKAPPGYVTFEGQRTLMAPMNPELLAQLLATDAESARR